MNNQLTWNGINLDWAYGDLLRYIRYKVTCPHCAKDVLHDALLRYALITLPNNVLQPHAYLSRIVSTVIVDNYREIKRYEPILPSNEVEVSTVDHFFPSAEYLVDLQQRLSALQVIINALPKKCRQVFLLYRIEGYSQREIALHLGVSLKTVEAHMARAMIDLSDLCEQLLTH